MRRWSDMLGRTAHVPASGVCDGWLWVRWVVARRARIGRILGSFRSWKKRNERLLGFCGGCGDL